MLGYPDPKQPVKAREGSKVTMEARPVQEITPDSAQLVREQTQRSGVVATIYKTVQTGQELPRERIEARGSELQKVYQRVTSMRLNKEGARLTEKQGILSNANILRFNSDNDLQVSLDFILPSLRNRRIIWKK